MLGLSFWLLEETKTYLAPVPAKIQETHHEYFVKKLSEICPEPAK